MMLKAYSRRAAAGRGLLARSNFPSSKTSTTTAAAALSTLSSRRPFVEGPESPAATATTGSLSHRNSTSRLSAASPRTFSEQYNGNGAVAVVSIGNERGGGSRSFSTAAAAEPPADSAEAYAGGSAPDALDAPASKPPFTKILVANRGEIALRVMKTCRYLGIRTVAVHSTVDSRSPHVLAADEAVCVGPSASSHSYLNVDAVCKAIRDTGAEAVHPGYGFLSENAEFARRVQEMGVKFIGPSSDAIVAMGDKIQSKKLAREAQVNVIPGFDGVIGSPEEAVKIAEDIGFPVMIKATAGGGGKGMRICRTPEQVVEGYHLSTAEAKSFFSDDRLFVERYIENPHHIEIQVLAGRKKLKKPETPPGLMNPYPIMEGREYGPLEILCFPERECSIQRRNQKIIEESPSTLLTPETRSEMVRQVKSLVRKVGYQSAGTVEFLVDEQQNFYFLEMNTRLQVEHPVTEMVSGGVDLVRGMIDVAGGRGVPEDYLTLVGGGGGGAKDNAETGEDADNSGADADGPNKDADEEGRVVPHVGHAIEARIYAEDPLRGFLPSIGPLLSYVEPPCISHTPSYDPDDGDGDGSLIDEDGCVVRIDSGVTEGSQISQYYDPMISKLVAYSPNSRSDAIRALGRALDRYVIRGVGHNAPFASDVLRHPDFIEGRTPTNFIERHYPDGFHGVGLTDEEREELAAIAAVLGREKRRSMTAAPAGEHSAARSKDGSGEEKEFVVCLGGMFGDAYRVALPPGEGRAAEVRKLTSRHESNSEKGTNAEKAASSSSAEQPPSRSISVSVEHYDPVDPVAELSVGLSPRSIQIGAQGKDGQFDLHMFGANVPVYIMSPREYDLSLRMTEPKAVDTSDLILSPMPGTLVSYAVEEGQHVEMGQEICVVEAMKMQNVIRAEREGVVKRMVGEVGGSLMADEVIVEFEKEGGDESK